MERLLSYRRKIRRHLPYRLCVGIAAGSTQEKTIWQKDRQSTWWDNLNNSHDQSDWYDNFRMDRGVFDFICDRLSDYLKPKDNWIRLPLKTRKRIAIAMYWMASRAEYRTVAHLFGVGKTTVCECVHDVSEALIHVLMNEYVNFPKDDDLKEVIKGFEKTWHFPNCAGAIDGSHIPIIAPQDSHSDYLNRKGWYSLILQGVCDHKSIFRDINIGWPGRVHDARVLASSELFHKGENSVLFPHWLRKISLPENDVSLPVVLIGDPAYPLRPWLMKPFCHKGSLSAKQKTFNYRLSSARMTIENAFGRLKGRWRCLQKRLDVDVKFACNVIASCVVLHNISERHTQAYDDQWDEEVTDDDSDNTDVSGEDDAGESSGQIIRDNIALAFDSNVL